MAVDAPSFTCETIEKLKRINFNYPHLANEEVKERIDNLN